MLAADLTKMQINAKVSEADIGQIHEKQKVKFEVDAYPDSFFGEVVQVRNSPIAEESVVNYDVIIAVNNPDMKLKPGMTAIVQIITGERSAVLRVPNGALRFRPASKNGPVTAGGPPSGGPSGGGGGGPAPGAQGPGFKPKQATDEKQLYLKPASPKDELVALKVKIGLSDGVQTEILSGLNEGDEVVLLQKPKNDEVSGTTNPFSGRR
jgi:HlyD family secretion protein